MIQPLFLGLKRSHLDRATKKAVRSQFTGEKMLVSDGQ